MDTSVPVNTRLKDRHRRLQADALLAALVTLSTPSNRAESRMKAKRVRRIASARRGVEREIAEKRAWRAWRKAPRLARAA